MPITLHPISRREFLAKAILAAATAASARRLLAALPETNPYRFALLADTHINANAGKVERETNMTDNLRRVAGEIAGLTDLPGAAFVVGDLAHHTGESGDYASFVNLTDPLRAAGLTVYLQLGNHDHRQNFWKAFPSADTIVENRHVAIVKTPRANFFLMDSLDVINNAPGRCGEGQLKWLARELDANADKPAITLVHHQPDERPNPIGLIDTKALLEVITPRRQVKAHVFGHTHDWKVTTQDGLHLINLPPTAYLFKKGKPNGWVDLQLEKDRAHLALQTLDPHHPQAGQNMKLIWR